jgi:hypothetical protein
MTTQADREMLAAPTGKSLVVREEMPQAKSVDNRGVGRHCTHARSSFHPRQVVISPTDGRHCTHAFVAHAFERPRENGCEIPLNFLKRFNL